MIDFLSNDSFHASHEAYLDTAKHHDTDNVEDWDRLHDALVEVAERFGEVTDHWEGGDFYHGGDWFNSITDGFAIRNDSIFRKLELRLFQDVISRHSPHAVCNLGGEVCTDVDGFECLVHPKVILVTWEGFTPDECEKHLGRLGFRNQ